MLNKVLEYFSIVSKRTLPLLFPSKILIIRSHICVEWILYIDHPVSKSTYTALCKEPPLPLSGPSIELLCSPMCDGNTKGCILFFLSHFWLTLIFVLCGTKTHPIFLRFVIGHATWLLFWSFFEPFSFLNCLHWYIFSVIHLLIFFFGFLSYSSSNFWIHGKFWKISARLFENCWTESLTSFL